MQYNKVYDINSLLYEQKYMTKKRYLRYYLNIYNISKSKEYNDLLFEYDLFINLICNLIKKLNLENPLEIICLLTKLLYKGYFSKDLNVNFNDDSIVDVLNLTWGSKVCTGNFVYRHCAMFFDDILKKLNIESELVDIIILNKLNIKKSLFLKEKNLISNHLAIGLKNDNKIYIYDPTNNMFLIKQNNIQNNDNILYLEGLSWDFDIINKYKYIYNKNNIYGDFNYQDMKNFNINDLNKIKEVEQKILNLINNNNELFDFFHIENSKKIRTLAYKNNELLEKQSIY